MRQNALPLQEMTKSFAAATPGDPDLQADLFWLLREESDDVDAANWVDLTTVIVEAILLYCREAKAEYVYVGALAKMAGKILQGRGESRRVDAGEAGRKIKTLGFSTERRDARGVKLRITDAVCARVHELAHFLDVPGVRECECKNVGSVG
jgi:hypothetical protein